MEFQIFILSWSFFVIINANQNKTRCYKTYCYTMLNEGVPHSSISDCPPPYQYLEIYNHEMMNDVIRFAEEIHARINYVELRLGCANSVCYWNDSKSRAEYMNWGGRNLGAVEPNATLVFLLTLRYDWFYVQPQLIRFSTICMEKIAAAPEESHSDFIPTSDSSIHVIPSTTTRDTIRREESVGFSNTSWNTTRTKDCKMELWIFVVVSGVFHLMALVTIVALIASRKRGHTYSLKKNHSKKKESETENQYEQKVESKYEMPGTEYQTVTNVNDCDDELCDYANLSQMKKK